MLSRPRRRRDLASVDFDRVSNGASPIFVEISHPWRLELLVACDDIRAGRSFVTISFDGAWEQPESDAVWEHLFVHGPSSQISQPPERAAR